MAITVSVIQPGEHKNSLQNIFTDSLPFLCFPKKVLSANSAKSLCRRFKLTNHQQSRHLATWHSMAAEEEQTQAAGPSSSAADGSVIGDKYASGQCVHSKGQVIPERYPTNKEVARAIEQQVAASVETYANYRHVAWYTAFLALYLLVLYFQVRVLIMYHHTDGGTCMGLQRHARTNATAASQAASFRAGDVVATLKSTLLPDSGSPHISFSSADQVLAYLGNKFVRPVDKDPICGDGNCEVPWEGPAWGPFGCPADCGLHPNTTKVIVTLSADFTGHPSLSPGTLRAQVSWNLCMRDELRQTRGLPPLCW